MEQVERSLAAIEEVQVEHGAALRAIGERLDRIIEILTPSETAGPTLDEILAQLVTVVSDQTLILRRLDGRTAAMAADMGVEEVVELPPPPSAATKQPRRAGKPNGHANGHGADEEPPAA